MFYQTQSTISFLGIASADLNLEEVICTVLGGPRMDFNWQRISRPNVILPLEVHACITI